MPQENQTNAKEVLCTQLGTVDTSLGFLLIIIASVLLSFLTVVIQRKALCLTLLGEETQAAALPDVYPLKRKAGAMVIGALGFFLCVALGAARDAAAGDDCVAKRSASTNVWASLFVLVAAIIRLMDLDFVEDARQSSLLEEDTLPA